MRQAACKVQEVVTEHVTTKYCHMNQHAIGEIHHDGILLRDILTGKLF